MQYDAVITSATAARLGPTPARRRQAALRLLRAGQATLAAVAAAWYAGDVIAARREIYAGAAGAERVVALGEG